MRVVFAGTPEVALPALEAIADSSHEVLAVVTRPDSPSGRGRKLKPSPVGKWAADAGLEVLKPSHPKDPAFQERLRDLAPQACPVVAYGALLPESVLEIPEHGWINLHFSLLPAWRGAAPAQYSIWSGDDVGGATAFRIVKELDAGPIFGTMTETIRPRDTAGDLLERLAIGGSQLLVSTLDGIEDGSIQAREQGEEGASYAPKITSADCMVKFSQSAQAVDRQVRACSPFPGAWCLYDEERFKLGPVEITDVGDLTPGVLSVSKNEVLVGTATTALRLGEVKAFGKKSMQAADWARGVRVESGAALTWDE